MTLTHFMICAQRLLWLWFVWDSTLIAIELKPSVGIFGCQIAMYYLTYFAAIFIRVMVPEETED